MYLGDASMYPVPSELRQQVWTWADSTGVKIEYNGTDFNVDVWRVVDPKHRDWFALRWL